MNTWIPRPPADDEPACWSWPIPPLLDREAWIVAEMATGLTLGAVEMMEQGGGGPESTQFIDFHADRCAVCGRRPRSLVDDHCHATGQTRGFLCKSCNTREGVSGGAAFHRYRLWHPAAILGFHSLYEGMGWRGGWSVRLNPAEARGARLTGDDRPTTPWKPWSDAVLDLAAESDPPISDEQYRIAAAGHLG